MAWYPAEDRYEKMIYNRCGNSGLRLPALSLGLWHNFGGDTAHAVKTELCQTAFDAGITHFDLANNYGPPPGSAESAFGEILRTEFHGLRDELVISSKAGYPQWPGPYGNWGSRKYLIASCDQSLKRIGVDYVDIFYSHRFDPDTPLEETMLALDHIVRSGRALYAGISSYNSKRTRQAHAILTSLGTPFIIHQPSYSMINRWIEKDALLDTLDELKLGSIVFSPLAQGMLSNKYLKGIPDDSRAAQGKSLHTGFLNQKNLDNLKALDAIATKRGQSLAQMAIAWVLRGGRVTSALIGASRAEQVTECANAISHLEFTAEELADIDHHAHEAGINLWAKSAELDNAE
jgi:L-glyceraldehyde 3-phosphate reductase